MTEMTARVRNRLQDGLINWQERRFQKDDFRQQQADIHRSRMTCSASLPSFHQTQDWTGGLSASNRIPVIEETKPMETKNERLQAEIELQAGSSSVCTEAVKLNLISSNGARTIRLTAPVNAQLTFSSAEKAAENADLEGRLTSNAGD